MSRQRKERWRRPSGCNVSIKTFYTNRRWGGRGSPQVKEWRLKLPHRKRERSSPPGGSVVWEDGIPRSPPWEGTGGVGRGVGERGSVHAEVRAGEERGGGRSEFGGLFHRGGRGWPRGSPREGRVDHGTRGEGGSVHTGPASPSARASLHSKLISNRKGLWKGLGFSSTATFSTDTLAIASPGRD